MCVKEVHLTFFALCWRHMAASFFENKKENRMLFGSSFKKWKQMLQHMHCFHIIWYHSIKKKNQPVPTPDKTIKEADSPQKCKESVTSRVCLPVSVKKHSQPAALR